MNKLTLLTITASAAVAMLASGCLVTGKATGTVGTSGSGTAGSGTTTRPGPRTTPGPRTGGDAGISIVIDWRSGKLGSAAKFSIEPSIGPVGTMVNIYGTFRPAFSGGAVTCQFPGAQPTSPFFVSLRRMVVRVPEGATSGVVGCRVGNERLWTGRFVVTQATPDIFAVTDEQQGALAAVYKLPKGTTSMPDFTKIGDPIGTFVAPAIFTSPRPIEKGFPGVKVDGEFLREWYAIRYVGLVYASRATEYMFKLKSSDGAKLYIDDTLVVNNDGVHGPAEKEGKIELSEGKHRIVVEYFKTAGAEIALEVWWKRGANPYTGIGRNALTRYAVEYDCSRQPLAVGCCKAMTAACKLCSQRQTVIMDAWRGQCTRTP